MASIKIIFRTSSADASEGTLYYRIIHNRSVKLIHTGCRIRRNEWNVDESRVMVLGTAPRQDYLKDVQKKLNDNMARLQATVSGLDKSGKAYGAADVAEMYLRPDAVVGFISFTRKLIDESGKVGHRSAVSHYTSALNSFIRFHGDSEIPFDDFDNRLMMAYELHLKSAGLTPNTTSYYMRKLRTIYNMAVERGLTEQRHPFRHVYTGIAKTRKRAVSLQVVKALHAMDLRLNPLSELARDIFLFSFYTRGMSIVDIAYLKKSNLRHGVLTYRRQKTGQQLHIRWESRMQEIVARHGDPHSKFLLPLIKPDGNDARRQYQNVSHMINRRLKKLGKELGLKEPLTMYCARHGWASIALSNNVPISVISRGLGHDSEKTTRIYLASLNTSDVDDANSRIMRLLDK